MKKWVLLGLILLGGLALLTGFTLIGGSGGASVSDSAYDATGWDAVTTVAPSKNAIRDKIETLPGGHDPITLNAAADTLLQLSAQEVQLDTQTANTIYAGPTTGAAATPTFRTIVDNDIPNNITITLAGTATALAADPANCGANQAAGGITAAGVGEACLDLPALYQGLDADLTTLSAPTAWRMFYSNGTSVVTQIALGTAGQVLASTGATSAPGFTDNVASAFGSDPANCPTNQAAGGITAAGVGEACLDLPALYQPLDADLTTLAAPGNWRVFYTNGSAALQALAIGATGKVLKSNGTTAAPTWEDDSTGTGLGTNLASATNNLFSTNGTLRFGASGGTNNESLCFNFESVANTVGVTDCDVTGVTAINMAPFDLTVKSLSVPANATIGQSFTLCEDTDNGNGCIVMDIGSVNIPNANTTYTINTSGKWPAQMMVTTGAATTLASGTAGTTGNLALWNTNNIEGSTIVATNVALKDGNTYTGVHDLGGATSVEIPNGTNPTVDAAGEVAIDTNNASVRFHDGTAARTLPALMSESFTILEPDLVQAIERIVALKHFNAESYPFGATLTDIVISTSATCTDSVDILERANSGTAWSTTSTVEAITLSGTRTEDDGTLTDSGIAADAYVAVDLGTGFSCDIGFLMVTLSWYVNSGN